MTDTNYYYAAIAERYMDGPDEDPPICGNCADWDGCPRCHENGLCTLYGEWRDSEADACQAYTERGDDE